MTPFADSLCLLSHLAPHPITPEGRALHVPNGMPGSYEYLIPIRPPCPAPHPSEARTNLKEPLGDERAAGRPVRGPRPLVPGFKFKENVRDVRNSRALDVVWEVEGYGSAERCMIYASVPSRETAWA